MNNLSKCIEKYIELNGGNVNMMTHYVGINNTDELIFGIWEYDFPEPTIEELENINQSYTLKDKYQGPCVKCVDTGAIGQTTEFKDGDIVFCEKDRQLKIYYQGSFV